MKKYPMLIYVVLFLIGATALWYFGHHQPAQKILTAEPKKVYKSTPLQPSSDLSVKSDPSDTIQKPREGDAIDTESKDMGNTATSEKIDDSHIHSEDTDSEESMSQETSSTEDATAAEAFEKYFTSESEYQAELEVFTEALKSGNSERIKSATNAFREVRLRRNEALQNLAVYSEDAVEILAQVWETERQADEVAAAFEAENAAAAQKLLAAQQELFEKYPFLRDMLIEHGFQPLK